MVHYDPKDHQVKLRCDGNHTFGEEYLTESSVSVALKDGEICLKISWAVRKDCTKEHTNDVKNVYNKCQKSTNVKTDSIFVPVSNLNTI